MNHTTPLFAIAALASLLLTSVTRADDTVYVSSNGSNSVEKITNGVVTQFISNSPNLSGPTGLVMDANGNLYVANNDQVGSGFVAKFDSNGNFLGNVATGLYNPRGLVMDSSGNLFVADQSAGWITEIPAGGGSQFTAVQGLAWPNGLSFDASGNLYVANGNGEVDKITFGGGGETTTPLITGLGNLNGVTAVTSGALTGDLLVVDQSTASVLEYNSDGDFIKTLFATSGHSPEYLAVDSSGDYYVTDSSDDMVTEYAADGSFIRNFQADADGNKAIVGPCGVIAVPQLVVPEPSTYALLIGGLGALFFISRRRKTVLA